MLNLIQHLYEYYKLTNAFVYMMSNKNLTTFYVRVTSDLEKKSQRT